ncbi:MAG: sulfotransferase family protein [Desulfohalobiaceae bacterium]|nr:sulfotransferase family protein [Desulfohalobiaceae bacterium]
MRKKLLSILYNKAYIHEKLVSNEKKFVWFKIPKVATTSIENSLTKQLNHLISKKNINLKDIYFNYNSYFKFAFVRNPWSRIVSCYLNKICHKNQKNVEMFFKKYHGLYYCMPFDKFVAWICSNSGIDKKANVHWISQYKFIRYKNKFVVNHIGYYENLHYDYKKICNLLKIHYNELSHQMSSIEKSNYEFKDSNDAKNYKQFYTKKTIEMIGKRYEDDIYLFKYKF